MVLFSVLLQNLYTAANPEQLAHVWTPSGSSVHWENLDVDFDIPELLAGIFGT